MRLVTGDECGFLKECLPSLAKTKDILSSNGLPLVGVTKEEGMRIINPSEHAARRRGVVDLTWTRRKGGFAALRLDGSVQVWERRDTSTKDFGTYHVASEVANVFEENTRRSLSPNLPLSLSRPIGISTLKRDEDDDDSEISAMVTCNSQGTVSILKMNEESVVSVVKCFSTFGPTTSPSTTNTSVGAGAHPYPAVGCMGVHQSLGWIAVGGKDRETTLYDIESSQKVWKAKNLPPHPQTLLHPIVWPSSILFLNDGHGMVVGSDLQVRLYDVRVDSIQRRPIAYTPRGLLEQRVTSMCQTSEINLVVADTTGTLMTLDLRNLKHATNQARFVGPAGSIRQLAKHITVPRLAAVGLDRMLRIYDTTSRKLVTCMYLKQRLNCVLMDESVNRDVDDHDDAKVFDGEGSDQEDVVRDYVDSDQEDNEEESAQDSSNDEVESGEDSQNSDDDSEEDDDSDDDDDSDQPRKRQRK